jgi:hypothetical protein
MNMGIGLYNKFPNKIMEVEKMRQFERVLRPCLLQYTFYSLDEYIFMLNQQSIFELVCFYELYLYCVVT